MNMQPSEDDIDEALKLCMDADRNDVSVFPMLNYEDGVRAALNWMCKGGNNPFADE